jgi:hypothetical protein
MHRLYYNNGITYDNNAVHMIGHDHKFIQLNTRVMVWDLLPALHGDFTPGARAITPCTTRPKYDTRFLVQMVTK